MPDVKRERAYASIINSVVFPKQQREDTMQAVREIKKVK